MNSFRQIKVGKPSTGIIGLDNALKDVAEKMPQVPDKEIAEEMGSPALVVKREVKAVESVPSKSKLRDSILEADLYVKETTKSAKE